MANYSKPPAGRTAVYRLFDNAGQLLYVGISCNPERRMKSHHARAWWTSVDKVQIEWHNTRNAALAAEYNAIQTENPTHNVADVPGRTRGTATKKDPKSARPRDADPCAYIFMSTCEIGTLLGVVRQRVQQIVKKRGFPAPYAELGTGRIWLTWDVCAWAIKEGRLAAAPLRPLRVWPILSPAGWLWHCRVCGHAVKEPTSSSDLACNQAVDHLREHQAT